MEEAAATNDAKSAQIEPERAAQQTFFLAGNGEENLEFTMRDARDEEDENSYDDPYTYSDDSASLSDAYFFPQSDDELAKPPRYREEDSLVKGSPSSGHNYPVASYYGSLNGADRALSPLWVGGSIQEDAELISSPNPDEKLRLSYGSDASLKDRRRHRRQMKKLQLKQKERLARERAVAQIVGQEQDVNEWQDAVFAVIFVLQLAVIFVCSIWFGVPLLVKQLRRASSEDVITDSSSGHASQLEPSNLHGHRSLDESLGPEYDANELEFTIDYNSVLSVVSLSGMYAFFLTYISFGCMLILAKALIQIMLVFSVLLALAWGIIGLSEDPYGIISMMGFSALLLTLSYAFASWKKISFAATNLQIALKAMRCTADVTLLGLASLFVSFLWCIIWSVAFVGLVNAFNMADCTTNYVCEPHIINGHIPLYIALLFSFHWTNTVIKNVVRVTVASIIGCWWFRPNSISPGYTAAASKPLRRSLTTSLGSICLGSLVVYPQWILALLASCFCCVPEAVSDKSHRMASEQRSDAETGVLDNESAADSLSATLALGGHCGRVHAFIRSCNRWSYTYIGMYGYAFEEAGERALQLFETREWLDVVRDNLIQNVLLMASVIIGGSTGSLAVVVEEMDGFDLTSFHRPVITAFVIGSAIGYVLGNLLLLGIISSAVDTILVCFAAGPFDFDKNHPALSREMRDVWSQQVWEN